MLDQTFVHCPIFLTAGRRVSLDLISVPVWLIILLRPTKDRRLGKLLNYQQPNPKQIYLTAERSGKKVIKNHKFILINEPFKFIQHLNSLKKIFVLNWKVKILHVLTRSPRKYIFSVRLACVKHTTSVHPEPGSNSYYFN